MLKDFKLYIGHADETYAAKVKEYLDRIFTIAIYKKGGDIVNTLLSIEADLAILDFSIPEIDIIELCEKLRNDQPDMSTVIYVSLDDLPEAKKKWRQRAIDYIVGPLAVEGFCEEINKVVRYILLDREREALTRHKIESNYLVNKKLHVFKALTDEGLGNKDWAKIEMLARELHNFEEDWKVVEKYNL